MKPTAVVTGGGNGIGKALCLELMTRGYQVVVSDIYLDEAQAVVREIKDHNGNAFAVKCDVTIEDQVSALLEKTVTEYGLPDLVFSNAGAGLPKPAVEVSRKDMEWLFGLNVFGMWDVAARFAKESIEKGKSTRIVVTGSEHSIGVPFGGSAAYSATKHAVLAMAEAMRIEWENDPVDISILCLGLTQSRFWESDRHRKDEKSEPNPMAAAVLAAGMPAETVAKISMDAVERGDFYIFTHSHVEEYAQKRYKEITNAFEQLNHTAPTDRSYDVEKVIAGLMAANQK